MCHGDPTILTPSLWGSPGVVPCGERSPTTRRLVARGLRVKAAPPPSSLTPEAVLDLESVALAASSGDAMATRLGKTDEVNKADREARDAVLPT